MAELHSIEKNDRGVAIWFHYGDKFMRVQTLDKLPAPVVSSKNEFAMKRIADSNPLYHQALAVCVALLVEKAEEE